MSDDIKAGDLVMVVKPSPCCGNEWSVGKLFVVDRVETIPKRKCSYCGEIFQHAPAATGSLIHGFTQLSRLKKIDPPAEGDSLPTRKDLEVTA